MCMTDKVWTVLNTSELLLSSISDQVGRAYLIRLLPPNSLGLNINEKATEPRSSLFRFLCFLLQRWSTEEDAQTLSAHTKPARTDSMSKLQQ